MLYHEKLEFTYEKRERREGREGREVEEGRVTQLVLFDLTENFCHLWNNLISRNSSKCDRGLCMQFGHRITAATYVTFLVYTQTHQLAVQNGCGTIAQLN